MRICSFLPSATEIIAELGLVSSLVGVSEECRWPEEVVGLPVVTAARIDPSELSSLEIDAAVRAALREGRSLYAVDADLVAELAPDVIVTQDLCAVCAVSSGELASACPVGAEVISLDPRTFDEVADSIRMLGRRLGAAERGAEIADRMRRTVETAAAAVTGLPRRRVFFAEWLEPPFCAGHWLPEMIAPGRRRRRPGPTWRAVVRDDVGGGVRTRAGARGGRPVRIRRRRRGGARRRRRLAGPAVAVDGDGYYSRPGPRLADGVVQLAHLFHPERGAGSRAARDPASRRCPATMTAEAAEAASTSPDPRRLTPFAGTCALRAVRPLLRVRCRCLPDRRSRRPSSRSDPMRRRRTSPAV